MALKERENQDGLQDRIIHIARVAKVVKGGRRFNFTAMVVAGDKQGKVSVGFGKANQVPEAIRKATAIIAELQATLDKDQGGDVAEQLDTLYEFSTMKLIEANLEEDIDKIASVREVLNDIYEGWQQIRP